MAVAARERKAKSKARLANLFAVGDEIDQMMQRHWRAFFQDSPAFFQQSYATYLKAPGQRHVHEKGTRGATVLQWQSIDEMRQCHLLPSRSSPPHKDKHQEKKEKEKKGNNKKRILVRCIYVAHDTLTPDSNPELHKAIQTYDPETSFVVAMWCAKPAVAQVNIIHRDARNFIDQSAKKENVLVVAENVLDKTETNEILITMTCCLPGCKVKSSDHKLKLCARCRTVMYCSSTCQRADWKRHKSVCMCYLVPSPSPSPSPCPTVSVPTASVPTTSEQEDGID